VQNHDATTPFGRRPLKLAHVAAQALAKTRPPEKVVHKWNVFRAICTAKDRIGASERSLAVLDALLSFHPETALTGEGLIVFPSNHQLSLRAHGMAPATLRRHIAVLVDCGLIVRRDSPNGKRYARKGRAGEIEFAFGFDLSPLVVRAEEFEAWAEEVRAEERALKLVRERITICRRDITKMIATGIEEGVATGKAEQGLADWPAIHYRYREIILQLPRMAARSVLEPIAEQLSVLADEILMLLEAHQNSKDSSGNESHFERHKQNSNPDYFAELEPDFSKKQDGNVELPPLRLKAAERSYPLGMVLAACPDIIDYCTEGIQNWRDFIATVTIVRPMLGISPSAWEEAQTAMGEIPAAIAVACILQRSHAINSAGGYLRELTRRADAGEFSIGPMLMALIGSKMRSMKRA
jgi:replication initiation protein RepC